MSKTKKYVPCYYGKVDSVSPLGGKKILITFAGVGKKIFDVSPYIKGEWMGMLADDEYFNKVYVHPKFNFTVAWPDGQSIDPENLFLDSVSV